MTGSKRVEALILAAFLGLCLMCAGADSICSCASKKIDNEAQIKRSAVTLLKAEPGAAKIIETARRGAGEARRLSQKLTVTTEAGILAVGGTVSRVQDSFYPGTYEVRFSGTRTLADTARVEVEMNVRKGDTVYVLTGDRDSGYKEYAKVTASEGGFVAFDTSILQDYTLSTTDICSAQIALDALFADSGQ